jgi:hypothetical protein
VQALLEQVCKRREALQRYKELVDAVEKARTQAAELKQADPDLADPKGVLSMLVAQSGPRASQSAPGPAEQTQTTLLMIIAMVLLAGAVLVLLIGVSLTNATARDVQNTKATWDLAIGNFMIGVGSGAGLGGLIMLGLSGRKLFSKWGRS